MVNEPARLIRIEVVYAGQDSIWRQFVQVSWPATIAQALEASEFFRQFPDLRDAHPQVGVFGRVCSLQHELQPGDRVEVYRPLIFDPMESRRRRAQRRQRRGASKLS